MGSQIAIRAVQIEASPSRRSTFAFGNYRNHTLCNSQAHVLSIAAGEQKQSRANQRQFIA